MSSNSFSEINFAKEVFILTLKLLNSGLICSAVSLDFAGSSKIPKIFHVLMTIKFRGSNLIDFN